MSAPICLDGSEGGGQVLRSALTLSLATRKPFLIERIRGAGPGLGPRLLGCVRAAQAVSAARVEGAEPGSERLEFTPGPVRAGHYLLDLGPAGSVPLVAQVVCPPLGLVEGSSTLRLLGCTHGASGPAAPYLARVWVPMMRAIGHDLDFELKSAGFEPEGGGEATVVVRAARPAAPFECRSRGTLRETRVLSTVSNLPFDIAKQQSRRVVQRLKEKGIYAEPENLPVPAPRSSGSLCLVAAAFERARAGFGEVGRAGEDADAVADRTAQAVIDFIRSRAALDAHLGTQLVLPLALAAAGLQGPARPVSRFTIASVTDELLVQTRLVEQFLDVEVAVLTGPENEAEVRIAPRDESLLAVLRASRQLDPS